MKFVFYEGGSFLSKFSVILLNTCQFSKNRVLLAGFCRRLRGVAEKTLEFWNQALLPCYSHPRGMGSFPGKPLVLSATTQPMVTGLLLGDMPQLAFGNPGRRTAYRTLLGFDWPWRWGTWSSQESGPYRNAPGNVIVFFPKPGDDFGVFQRFLPTFRSGNLAGFFSTNHGVVQSNSSKQVGFWHTSSLDSSPKLPRPLVNALLAVNPEAGAYWN